VATLRADAALVLDDADPRPAVERVRALDRARAYVASSGAFADEVRRTILAPLALADAAERGSESAWRALLSDAREGPEADRARAALARLERARMGPFVRPDLPPDHAAVIEALGRASMRGSRLTVVFVPRSSVIIPQQVASRVGDTLRRELERHRTFRELEVVAGRRARDGDPRLEIAWSLTTVEDAWTDGTGRALDGFEASAEIALSVGDLRWARRVDAVPRASGLDVQTSAFARLLGPDASVPEIELEIARDALDRLATAIVRAVMPPR
ncbi:MAG: hypothetical protein M3Y87_26315, partial [Myxococcota bacterium]|nr:hypothetical protein [Myxococcota bacterium]